MRISFIALSALVLCTVGCGPVGVAPDGTARFIHSPLGLPLFHVADAPPPQPVAVPPAGTYHAVLTLIVHGSDGTLGAQRETDLPFIPQPGLSIDLHVVDMVTWSTRQKCFTLVLHHEDVSGIPARNALKAIAALDGAEWKENFFSPISK